MFAVARKISEAESLDCICICVTYKIRFREICEVSDGILELLCGKRVARNSSCNRPGKCGKCW